MAERRTIKECTVHWMFSCKDVSQLLSESMDRGLPFYQRILMRMHLLMCKYLSCFDAISHPSAAGAGASNISIKNNCFTSFVTNRRSSYMECKLDRNRVNKKINMYSKALSLKSTRIKNDC